jgi:hypothetical protein
VTEAGEPLLADSLVRDYMNRFAGYGNLAGLIWYIGMEEAGVERSEQARRRMSVWSDLGTSTVDLREYHRLIDDFRCFKEVPEHQATWRGPIRIDLAVSGQTTDVASVLRHQQHSWGRSDGNQALLELYPLPKRALRSWDYHHWTSLPELRTPDAYYSALLGPREAFLGTLLTQHEPRFVVFYGKGKGNRYVDAWQRLAGGPFEPDRLLPPKVIGWRRAGRTTFLAMEHTVARGWKNDDFAAIGSFLRQWTKD